MSAYSFTRSVLQSRNIESVLSIHGFNGTRTFTQKEGLEEFRLRAAKPYKSMPRVPMLPFIGSAWAYFPYIGRYNTEEMHKADLEKYKTYGNVVRERFGSFEVVNSYHPDAMYTMINNDEEYPSRGDFATLKAYRKKRRQWYQPAGLLVAEGKEWSELRNTLQDYILKPRHYQYYIEPMNSIAEDFAELIRQKRDGKEEVDDAVSFLNKWSLEAMSYIALDDRLGCLNPALSPESDAMKMIKAIETQLKCMNKLEASAGNIPLWKLFPTPTWRKFVKAADVFTSLAFNYITKSTFSSRFKQLKHGKHPSLLQYLTKIENAGISSAMVMMADLMMAGIDTTSYAAGFLLYDLAKNPKKQEEAIRELSKLLPNKEDKLTFEVYEKLEYLKHCLKESMRLHPIVRGNVRIFKNDYIICGYRVPAGTAIICVLQVVYRNPKYFPYPDQFLPERWEDEKQTFSFIQPFGSGLRSCVGSRIAELEILTMTAEILRNFTLEYHYEDVGMRTRLINTPDKPMRLRFQER